MVLIQFLAIFAISTTPVRVGGYIPELPKVQFNHGGISVGIYLSTVGGRVVDSFLGIPYAESPVGDLRFAGSEDCLYVNVYTPHNRKRNARLPVIVWFHGGAFKLGGSDSKVNGPERLLDNDVVLVTVNYRLNLFGFLSTGNEASPGNYGLKDQNMALQWVRENINVFGGDPRSVTLAGQSAGGASVSLHMFSPLSERLFHRAIMQSRNCFDQWAIVSTAIAINRTRSLAAQFNCLNNDLNATITCMRQIPADDIMVYMCRPRSFESSEPLTYFAPVVEPNSSNAFLPKHPRDVRNPYGHKIPIIIGATIDDGLMNTAAIIEQNAVEFEQFFDQVLPKYLYYADVSPAQQTVITKQIDDFYLGGQRVWTSKNHTNLTNAFSDALFYSGIDRFLRNRFAAKKFGPTYVYVYNHRGPSPLTEFLGGGPDYYGVAHLDELPYLFPWRQIDEIGTCRDWQMRYKMRTMWTNFARSGNPTREWVSVTKYPLNYAKIGSETLITDIHDTQKRNVYCLYNIVRNRVGLIPERINFWRYLQTLVD